MVTVCLVKNVYLEVENHEFYRFDEHHQIFYIFCFPTKGLSNLSFFLPYVTKSTSHLWSSGNLCTLQKSLQQCLQLYPRIPIFLLQTLHLRTFFFIFSSSFYPFIHRSCLSKNSSFVLF